MGRLLKFQFIQVLFVVAGAWLFQSCAPALKQSSSIQFEIKPPANGVSTSALSGSASAQFELSGDYCYAINVTAENASFMRAQKDPQESCPSAAPGVGILKGVYQKGARVEIEVSVGPKRRFDLLALPKSKLPNGACEGLLAADVFPDPNDGHQRVKLKINGQEISEEADDAIRLIASGTVDIEPKDLVVELTALSDADGVEYGCGGHNGGSGGSGGATGGSGSSAIGFWAQTPVSSTEYVKQTVNSGNYNHFRMEGSCPVVGGTVNGTIEYAGYVHPFSASCTSDTHGGRWFVDNLDLYSVVNIPNPMYSTVSVVDGLTATISQSLVSGQLVSATEHFSVSTRLRFLGGSTFQVVSGALQGGSGYAAFGGQADSSVQITCAVGWTACPGGPLSVAGSYFSIPIEQIGAPAGWTTPTGNSAPQIGDMFIFRQRDENGIDVVLYAMPY